MSLLAAQALITNATLRNRVEAAIRATAHERIGWTGPAGHLARGGFADPGSVAQGFMLRLATNSDVVGVACESCGHANDVPDGTLEGFVRDSWESVADDLHGEPGAPED